MKKSEIKATTQLSRQQHWAKLRLTFIRGVARLLQMKFPSEEVNKSQKQPPLFSSLSTVEVQI